MKLIPNDEIPNLPVKDIFNEECIAFGVGETGAMIHFIDRDKCVLVEWADVILYGSEVLKAQDKKEEKEIEIEAPTEE